MPIVNDWVRSAAEAIADRIYAGEEPDEDEIEQIIAEHCPFERDVAYKRVDLHDDR